MMISPLQEAAAVALAAHSRVDALLLLCRESGCSLREATDTLDRISPLPPRPAFFLLVAELIAIGPFSPPIAAFLDYSPEDYRDVATGAPVTASLVQAYSPEDVAALARMVGTDPADMNQWNVAPEAVDAAALTQAEYCEPGRVEALRAAGFSFHFFVGSEGRD